MSKEEVEAMMKQELKLAQERKEDTCCKCGSMGNFEMAHKLFYESVTDELEKTCYRCGYKWQIKPKDHKDET